MAYLTFVRHWEALLALTPGGPVTPLLPPPPPTVMPAIVVNHELMASSSVLVAGDAAYFPSIDLGRMTVRSADHAYHSGWVAGKAF